MANAEVFKNTTNDMEWAPDVFGPEDETADDAEQDEAQISKRSIEQTLDILANRRNDVEGLDEIVTSVLSEHNEESAEFVVNEILSKISEKLAEHTSHLEGLDPSSDEYLDLTNKIATLQDIIDKIGLPTRKESADSSDSSFDAKPLDGEPETPPQNEPEIEAPEETEEDEDDEEEEDKPDDSPIKPSGSKKAIDTATAAGSAAGGAIIGGGAAIGIAKLTQDAVDNLIPTSGLEGGDSGDSGDNDPASSKEAVQKGEIASAHAAQLEISENVNNALDDTEALVHAVEHDGAMQRLATDLFTIIDMLNTSPMSPDFEKTIRNYSQRGIDITRALRTMVNEAGITQANAHLDGIENAINNISVVIEQRDEEQHPNGIVRQLIDKKANAEAHNDN